MQKLRLNSEGRKKTPLLALNAASNFRVYSVCQWVVKGDMALLLQQRACQARQVFSSDRSELSHRMTDCSIKDCCSGWEQRPEGSRIFWKKVGEGERMHNNVLSLVDCHRWPFSQIFSGSRIGRHYYILKELFYFLCYHQHICGVEWNLSNVQPRNVSVEQHFSCSGNENTEFVTELVQVMQLQ